MPDQNHTSLLFVCLGNICRSPLAEGLFVHLARERGVLERFRVDSAGTGGWHAGEPADGRMRAVAARRGVELTSRARRVEPRSDFPGAGGAGGFDLIVAMDLSNRDDLLDAGAPAERVSLLRSWDPTLAGRPERDLEVPDPYYGGPEGFERVFEMVERACAGLLDGPPAGPR